MSKIIEVIILPGGHKAKELNINGEMPPVYYPSLEGEEWNELLAEHHKGDFLRWQKTEASRREFEIAEVFGKKYPHIALGIKFYSLLPNKKYEAEILDNGKIRIK